MPEGGTPQTTPDLAEMIRRAGALVPTLRALR